jgi:hypothetical protein
MGREDKGRKEERDDSAPNKIPGPATVSQCATGSASIFDKCCHSKNVVNFMNAFT